MALDRDRLHDNRWACPTSGQPCLARRHVKHVMHVSVMIINMCMLYNNGNTGYVVPVH